jgi:hypothetical protein
MSYATIETKKFLNATGVGHLWEKIRDRYDSKLDNVVASDDSVVVTGNNGVGVQISSESGNALQLKTSGNKGLYVAPPAAADTYTMTKLGTASSGAAASYKLQKYVGGTGTAVDVGATIDIPKDMVVESGAVVTKGAPSEGDPWPYAGTFIELTLANASEDKLYIDVAGLIEYVTSGSQVGDMIVIAIDGQHKVTATITDGTVTKAKLASGVQASLDLADSAVQSVAEGSTNGTVAVDGTDVAVHGLGSAAYTDSTAYDASGAAAAVLGADTDAASAATVYGVKKYASDAYEAIVALSNNEIDAAIAAANTAIDTPSAGE